MVQVLADFLDEYIWSDDKFEEAIVKQTTKHPDPKMTWIIHMDGASNAQGSGARLILINLEEVVTKYALRFSFKATNNQTKYETLLVRLKLAKQLRVGSLWVFTNF